MNRLTSFPTNMYLAGYWEYRTYKANRLPSLTLNMTPAQYNRDITKRYDSEQDLDIYRSQQSFYAYGNLAVRQNFDLTGGIPNNRPDTCSWCGRLPANCHSPGQWSAANRALSAAGQKRKGLPD